MSNQKGILSALALTLLVSACGGSSKATPPQYPYPEPKAVEDTELGVYLESADEDDLDADEE